VNYAHSLSTAVLALTFLVVFAPGVLNSVFANRC